MNRDIQLPFWVDEYCDLSHKINIISRDIYFKHTIKSRLPENVYIFLIDVRISKILILYSLLGFTDIQYITY